MDTSGKKVKPVIAHIFKHDGLSFGIEICADHCTGTLVKAAKKSVDVQVLVSCGMSFSRFNMAVNKGGIAFHCDGNLKPPKNKLGFTAFVSNANKESTVLRPSDKVQGLIEGCSHRRLGYDPAALVAEGVTRGRKSR